MPQATQPKAGKYEAPRGVSPPGHRGVLSRRERRLRWAKLWGGAVVGLLLMAPFGEWIAAHVWACPFKSMTGFPCPSCGLTRAALALSHFQFVEALVRYPLATVLWICFIVGGLLAGAMALLRRPLPSLGEQPLWIKISALLVVVANWIYSIVTGV